MTYCIINTDTGQFVGEPNDLSVCLRALRNALGQDCTHARALTWPYRLQRVAGAA